MICPAPCLRQNSVTEALDHCRNIYHAPNFKFRTRVFGYALSGACFAFMVGGSVQDFLVSFVIALLMGCTLVYLERKKIPFFVAPLMGGLVTGLAAARRMCPSCHPAG